MNPLVTAYAEYARRHMRLADSTIRSSVGAIGRFVTWTEKQLRRAFTASDFTLSAIEDYDAYCKTVVTQQGRVGYQQSARATVALRLRSFGRFLQETGRLPDNPAAGFRVKVKSRRQQICATEEEVNALFAACDLVTTPGRAPMYRACIALLAYCGLRRSEVVDLTLDDLHLRDDRPHLTVQHGKGDKSRDIPLHPDARAYLSAWLSVRPESKEGYLFMMTLIRKKTGLDVVRMSGDRLRGIIRQLSKLSGKQVFRTLTPHTFRRFFATKLLEVEGSNLRYVADALGHSSITTTILYIGSHSGKLHNLIASMQIKPKQEAATPAAPVRRATDNRSNAPVERHKRPSWRKQ